MPSILRFGLFAATTFFSDLALARPGQGYLSPTLAKRASYTVTTGVQGSSGIQPRYEIRQLQQSEPEQYDLFILALRAWMDADNSNAFDDSYYAIAGIHGIPEVSWGGVDECSDCSGAYGYCEHESVNFPGWHRAYLALFEQVLVENAISVARTYENNQDQMVQAAQNLRVPFWDWAAHPAESGEMFPPVFLQENITVNGPSGSTTIDNPLYQYQFADPSYHNPFSPFNNWVDTLRYPNGQSANAQSQDNLAQEFLSAAQPSLQEQTYNLLSNCPEWQSFSNTNGGSAQCSMSIEGIHNRIHSLTGGVPNNGQIGGHMAYLPVAAFDAAFWMHHANVDRLLALWQTLNPDSWGASQPIGYETWTYPKGDVQDADSPLTPFYRDDNGDFHTLNTVRDYAQTFNYQYPEFLSTDGSQQSIRNIVAAYYGPNATLTAGSIPASSSGSSSSKRGLLSSLGSLSDFPGLPKLSALESFFDGHNNQPGLQQEQYVANVVANTNALGSTYTICMFDGQPSESAERCELNPNFIGSVVMMTHGEDSYGASYGAVPLTFFLQKQVNAGKLSSMSQDTVLPWLTDNLHWCVVGSHGEVPADKVDGLSVSVYSSSSQIPSSGGLPVWSAVEPQLSVTKGKMGGASSLPNFVSKVMSGLL